MKIFRCGTVKKGWAGVLRDNSMPLHQQIQIHTSKKKSDFLGRKGGGG